jgi:hypothetical protein
MSQDGWNADALAAFVTINGCDFTKHDILRGISADKAFDHFHALVTGRQLVGLSFGSSRMYEENLRRLVCLLLSVHVGSRIDTISSAAIEAAFRARMHAPLVRCPKPPENTDALLRVAVSAFAYFMVPVDRPPPSEMFVV